MANVTGTPDADPSKPVDAKIENLYSTSDKEVTYIISLKDGIFSWSYNGSDDPPVPPYIANFLTSIFSNNLEIQKFSFSIQYLKGSLVREDTLISEDTLALSYDTQYVGNKCHRPATFEIVDRKAFIDGQIVNFFKLPKSETNVKKWYESSGFIDHKMEITNFSKNDGVITSITLKSFVTLRRHPAGEYSATFMAPRFPGAKSLKGQALGLAGIPIVPGETIRAGEPVFAKEMISNLESTELAMSALPRKIVFVRGDPGSGKETYAKAIHYGSKIDLGDPKSKDPLTRSVAGMSLDTFRETVFGVEKDGILRPGLIAAAGKGTIFLDEFDKFAPDAQSVYSELLRVWEAGEYLPVGAHEIKNAKEANWVVAGAFTSQRTIADLPPDIWSRFNAQISIKLPLSKTTSEEHRRNYIHALVFSFMFGLGIDRLKLGDDAGMEDALKDLSLQKSRTSSAVAHILFGKTTDVIPVDLSVLTPSKLLCYIAQAVAKYMDHYWCVTPKTDPDENPLRSKFDNDASPQKDSKDPKRVNDVYYCLPICTAGKKLNKDNTTNLKSEGLGEEWKYLSRKLAPKENTSIVPMYDSIRAVRQACIVIFERLYEWETGAPKIGLDRAVSNAATQTIKTASNVDQQDSIDKKRVKLSEEERKLAAEFVEKSLDEAFSTVDLARQGQGLERLMSVTALRKLRMHCAGAEAPKQIAEFLSKHEF